MYLPKTLFFEIHNIYTPVPEIFKAFTYLFNNTKNRCYKFKPYLFIDNFGLKAKQSKKKSKQREIFKSLLNEYFRYFLTPFFLTSDAL